MEKFHSFSGRLWLQFGELIPLVGFSPCITDYITDSKYCGDNNNTTGRTDGLQVLGTGLGGEKKVSLDLFLTTEIRFLSLQR